MVNLLSNAGTQALQNYQNTSATYMTSNGTKYTSNYANILSNISTYNSSTGTNTGFNSSSILSSSSGLGSYSSNYGSGSSSYSSGSTSSSYYSGNSSGLTNYWSLGTDGLNRNGAVSQYKTTLSAIPTSVKDYVKSSYGSSLSGNYCTSIQSVALGQNAPTSVFEQRLNYHLDYEDQRKPGELLNAQEYFDVDSSSAASKSSSSSYNVFSTEATSSSAASSTNVYKTSSSSQSAANAKTVSSLMSLLA